MIQSVTIPILHSRKRSPVQVKHLLTRNRVEIWIQALCSGFILYRFIQEPDKMEKKGYQNLHDMYMACARTVPTSVWQKPSLG